jgi:hypothetical protein
LKKHKSPFFNEKPSGTLPKRNLEDTYEWKLILRMKEAIKKLKNNAH